MKQPKLLDLFCGAGGAAMGYHRAGYQVTGVDIRPQPHYPFEFIQDDALEYLKAHGSEFDAIHASPPCQRYCPGTNMKYRHRFPDLIGPVRLALSILDKPYAIENVQNAPLVNPLRLCGTMFGLRVIRHRLFECSPAIYFAPAPCCHRLKVVQNDRKPNRETEYAHVVGNFSDLEYASFAMGIDWMEREELKEAIPPAYTEFIGKHLKAAIQVAA